MILLSKKLASPLAVVWMLLVGVFVSAPAQAQRTLSLAQEPLTVGSKAPKLSVEHWVQDGNGFFKPVEDFSADKVYVVEFWATWCPPCVASMPHLAELQEKFRGRDVQIISISTEPLETVTGFLERKHPQVDKLVAEITSGYCLTTDPDESTYSDYMEAAGENGIPMAFIVGKSGVIEWMGHPMSMGEPLESIVEDTWDIEAFKEERRAEKRREELGMKLSELYASDQIDAAIQLIEDEMKVTEPGPFKELLVGLKYEMRFESNRLDDEVFAFYRKRLDESKDQINEMGQLAMSTLNALRRGSELKGFDLEVIEAFDSVSESLPKPGQAQVQQIIAQMHIAREDLAAAVGAQEKAVEASTGRQQERLQQQLEMMQASLKESAEKESAESDDEK
ncbi:MAG: redoxin domain-containing protein [Planctomycetota bacterium]